MAVNHRLRGEISKLKESFSLANSPNLELRLQGREVSKLIRDN